MKTTNLHIENLEIDDTQHLCINTPYESFSVMGKFQLKGNKNRYYWFYFSVDMNRFTIYKGIRCNGRNSTMNQAKKTEIAHEILAQFNEVRLYTLFDSKA
jgi:hypothetical protein